MKRETMKLLTIPALMFILIILNLGLNIFESEKTKKGRLFRVYSKEKGSRIQFSRTFQEAIQ